VAKSSHSEYIACVTQFYALKLILITNRPQCTIHQQQCGITTKETKEATGEQKKAKYSDRVYVSPQIGMNPIPLLGLPVLEY
jgi:hypothetical protein